MKAKINGALLKALPAGPAEIHDEQLPGFVLRVRQSGCASYRVTYARGRVITLGKVDRLKPAEARRQAQAILGEAAKGNDPGAARKRARAETLREFLSTVYEPWLRTNRKDGAATAARIRACFDRDLGGKRLHEITPWLVEKWRTERRKAGKAPATLNRDIGALRAALNHAVNNDLADVNPLSGKVSRYKVDTQTAPRCLTDDEDRQLREALIEREERMRAERDSANAWRAQRGYPTLPRLDGYTDHLRPLVLLALNTGMRRGELFNLRWADVDLDRAKLTVQGAGAKSGQSRTIALNGEALGVLRTLGVGEGYVFPARDGGRLNHINKSWRGIVKAAGLVGFRFHDLRHTFASRLIARGVDLATVRDLLGHADFQMVSRYTHTLDAHRAEAVARLVG